MTTTAPFDPMATCPLWERTIAETFNHDAALIAHVHRAVGYSRTGCTSEQVCWLSHGVGSNGKGTFLNTLACVLGDYGYQMPFSTVLAT